MTEIAARPPGSRLQLGLAVGLFAVALLFRLIGIGWGLKNDLHNASYHPDEPFIFGVSRQIEPAALKFTPGFYNYGTLYLSALRVASDVVTTYSGGPKTQGGGWSWTNPDRTDWDWVARCNLVGRVISALAGAGTVLMVFLILARAVGLSAGVVGGLVLTVAPAHVVHSRFQTVDVFATFLLAVSAYFALRLIPKDGEELPAKFVTKLVLLSGCFAGLSAGTKYTGVLGILTLFTVLFLCHRPRFLRDAFLGLLACAVAFVVATPGAVLEFDKFKADVGFEMSHTAEGHGLVFAGTSSGYLYHLGNLMSGMGPLILLLGLGGLAWAAYRKHVWAVALLAFFIPYYLVIGGAQDKYMRYTFPLFIGVAVGAGYVVAVAHRKGGYHRAIVAAGILAIGGADSGGLIHAAHLTIWMVSPDPRDTAALYLKDQSKSDPKTVVGLASDPWYWSPPLFPDSAEPRSVPFNVRMAQLLHIASPPEAYFVPQDGAAHPFDDRLISVLAPTFVSYSSLETTPLARLAGESDISGAAKGAASQYASFMRAIKATYSPDRSFGEEGESVEDMQYVQPVIYLWKRNAPP